MERLGHRTPVHAAQPVRLRELGYDERWLQDWLAADPTRLGLGQVVVLAQELTHATGGSLDILAADGDTYYSVEVQLGEVDASHGFRVLDYWARNRARYPDKTHVAALLVESADGRFRQALQAIAEYLPLIVVALRAWRGASEVVLVPEPLIVNESLDVGGTVGLASGKVRTEQDWREQLTEEAWAFYEGSSPGLGSIWARSGWTTAPSPTSACGGAGGCGRRCGFAATARPFTCLTRMDPGLRSRRWRWRPSANGSTTRGWRPPGSAPTTPGPTRSACACAARILTSRWSRNCCGPASRF
jgi:hypothetical protein